MRALRRWCYGEYRWMVFAPSCKPARLQSVFRQGLPCRRAARIKLGHYRISHDLGACITGQMIGAAPRFKAILSLGSRKQLSPDLLKRVDALMRRTFDLAEERNRIVHDPWYLDKDTDQPGQFRSMPFKKPHYGIKDIGESDIRKTLDAIRVRRDEAGKLCAEIVDALSTSQRKPL